MFGFCEGRSRSINAQVSLSQQLILGITRVLRFRTRSPRPTKNVNELIKKNIRKN